MRAFFRVMFFLSALIVLLKWLTGAYGADLNQLEHLYFYRAHIIDVYDGDTVTANIDLGLNIWIHNAKLRLYGINTPELKGPERPEGLKARDRLRDLVLNRDVMIQTYKDKTGKYGRYLAIIFIPSGNDKLIDINQQLIIEGYAVRYMDD